jgi:hypothetical protein
MNESFMRKKFTAQDQEPRVSSASEIGMSRMCIKHLGLLSNLANGDLRLAFNIPATIVPDLFTRDDQSLYLRLTQDLRLPEAAAREFVTESGPYRKEYAQCNGRRSTDTEEFISAYSKIFV